VPETEEEPEIVLSLDLRGLQTRLVETEGDLVMLVDDGDVGVEFSSGMDGTWEQAIRGAQLLASTALAYGEALRTHRPTTEHVDA
jgi:hypothetical protein